MKLERLVKEIIVPFVLAVFISFLLSTIECCNCFTFFKTDGGNDVFSSIIQIESLLFAGIITALSIRLNLVDNAINKNMERFNDILPRYGYYGYVLFENQFEKNYNKLIEKINIKLSDLKDDNKSVYLDKKNADFCFKNALPELKRYRKAHFDAIKYLLILFLLIISLSLVVIYIDFGCLYLFKKILKTTIVLIAIYSVYITYGALKELFNHPFIFQDYEQE